MLRLARFFGAILVFLLGCALCTVLALFVLGAFCVTYPLLRLSPNDARLKAGMALALDIAALAGLYSQREQASEQEADDGDAEVPVRS